MTIGKANTIAMESLEETVFKMLKANLQEFRVDREKATTKYMKKALELKSIARAFLDENKDDYLRYIEFSLKGGKC